MNSVCPSSSLGGRIAGPAGSGRPGVNPRARRGSSARFCLLDFGGGVAAAPAFSAGVKVSLTGEPSGISGGLPLSGGPAQSIYRGVVHPAAGFMARLALVCPSAACVHGEVGGVSGACSASQCGENRRNSVYATTGWHPTADGLTVTGRRDACFGAGSRPSPDPKRRDVTRRHADQSLTAGRDRQPSSQAKEPLAIHRTKGPETWGAPCGGSSRRPATRIAGPSCSGKTAAEALCRSGWKPRASPHSGGVSGRQSPAKAVPGSALVAPPTHRPRATQRASDATMDQRVRSARVGLHASRAVSRDRAGVFRPRDGAVGAPVGPAEPAGGFAVPHLGYHAPDQGRGARVFLRGRPAALTPLSGGASINERAMASRVSRAGRPEWMHRPSAARHQSDRVVTDRWPLRHSPAVAAALGPTIPLTPTEGWSA